MIKRKLQHGDYTNKLTEEEWDQLIKIENNPFCLTYEQGDGSIIYIGIHNEDKGLLFHGKDRVDKMTKKNYVPKSRFISRAKNTYNK